VGGRELKETFKKKLGAGLSGGKNVSWTHNAFAVPGCRHLCEGEGGGVAIRKRPQKKKGELCNEARERGRKVPRGNPSRGGKTYKRRGKMKIGHIKKRTQRQKKGESGL